MRAEADESELVRNPSGVIYYVRFCLALVRHAKIKSASALFRLPRPRVLWLDNAAHVQ